eukprot:scaffold860_cov57-Phaeocystis_antarctica.AAC.1
MRLLGFQCGRVQGAGGAVLRCVRGGMGMKCTEWLMHVKGPGRTGAWVRWQGSRPERREGRVALERLGERHAFHGAEVVVAEAAHTAKEGEKGECSARACCAAVTHGRVGSRWQGSRPERREGRVALERLDERHASHGAEFVLPEAAHTAKEGEKGGCSARCMLWAVLASKPCNPWHLVRGPA